VAQDAAGTYLLVMIEERPWGGDPKQAVQLNEKLTLYLSYALDGQLVRDHPETRGRAIVIQLSCSEAPHGEAVDLLARAAQAVSRYGLEFRVRVLPPK